MIILKIKCFSCLKIYEVKVKQEDYDRWKFQRVHVQVAMPYLSPAERELLISQTCDNCWKKMMGDSND
jgi:hypothetical protein